MRVLATFEIGAIIVTIRAHAPKGGQRKRIKIEREGARILLKYESYF